MITLCIVARYHTEGFRNLIDSSAGNVAEILVAVDDEAEPGILGYRPDVAQYFRHPVAEDFGGARNFLIDKATQPWIFHMDTDESLSHELWVQLNSLCDKATAPLLVFSRQNIIEGFSDRLGWPDFQPRLHRSDIRFQNRVHECLMPNDKKEMLPDHCVIVHRKTVADQHVAIKKYASIQGHKTAIMVWEWKRPHYLRICLDSLAKCRGIEQWPILLSIDGPEFVSQFEELFRRVTHVIPWKTHEGNLHHISRSLRFIFDAGYERVLFMDGDCILRTDTLELLPDHEPGYLFIGLTKGTGDGRVQWFAPSGNVLGRNEALPLLDWIEREGWVGKQRPGEKSVMRSDYSGYDGPYCRYMIDHGLFTRYRDKSYIGHIGVCGVDCHAPEIEAELMAGHPDQWLQNAIRMFNHKRHPAFVPEDFRYED